ncbi:MAG: serine/threonine-protein kinase [Myxococcota bacterium]|nr:serine/threonine-protein kinase [Myxococcota bacterium]
MSAIQSPPRFAAFGRYLLLERMATGGMAEVYLAKHFAETGEVSDLLAVKRIRPSLAADSEFIRMFLDEAKIAGQLHHPGIVQIRELGRIGASHYLAMDFVWGKDLLQIIRRCRMLGAQLSPPLVAWLGASLCEALHYAHTRSDKHGEPMRIIHRDVSPQNVLVSFDGRVKVIDFGIAKAASRSTHTQAGVLKGKVGYMSPEQVQGKRIDHRSDLFAVGTCLWELLTLRSLFARENNYDAMENVRHARTHPVRKLRPDVPEAFAAVLDRALQADPEQRWQSARDMKEALLRYVSDADPSFDRVTAVGWMRDAFRKEFHLERGRLEAFDQLGRPQVRPTDEPRRTSVVDLQIPDAAPPDPEWATEHATIDLDLLAPFDGGPPIGPDEVFFTATEITEPPIPQTDPGQTVGSDAPPPHEAEPEPQPEPQPDPQPLPMGGDVSVAPQRIDSQVIRSLMPTEDAEAEERKRSAREPTARQQIPPRDAIAPPGRRGSGAFAKVLVALVFLALGVGGGWVWFTMAGRATIEVRTVPDVGAIVLFDGASRGAAPLRLEEVAPGRHAVTIVADGYRDVTRELDVASHAHVVVEVALEPLDDP